MNTKLRSIIILLAALFLGACARESMPPTTPSVADQVEETVANSHARQAAARDRMAAKNAVDRLNKLVLDGCQKSNGANAKMKCACIKEAYDTQVEYSTLCDSKGEKISSDDEQDDENDVPMQSVQMPRVLPLPPQLIGSMDSPPPGWNRRLGYEVVAPYKDCNMAVAVNGVFVQWGSSGFGVPRMDATHPTVKPGTGMPMRSAQDGSIVAGNLTSVLLAGHVGYIDFQYVAQGNRMIPNNVEGLGQQVHIQFVCYAISQVVANVRGVSQMVYTATPFARGDSMVDFRIPGRRDLSQIGLGWFWPIATLERPIWTN